MGFRALEDWNLRDDIKILKVEKFDLWTEMDTHRALPMQTPAGNCFSFITYPKEDDDNSWSTDQLQRLLDFPDHVPASCSRVERISGLILSEEHTKRTDWQDLAEQLLDDDPTDPTWSNFLADSSVADQQSKVPQSSSNISVHQPQIQQHHPLPSRDMTNVANPVSNAPLNKPRMRWTPELHEAFIEAVNQLGGGERATPKGILMAMNVEGLTIYQVKSHLQKYRTARFKPEVSEGSSDRRNTCGHVASLDWKMSMDITEALRLQMEVQKQLHEQLEIQRKLQLQIEEQGKCLLQMLENQNKLEQEKSVASSFPAPISISNAIDSVKSEGSELDHLKVGAPGENSHSLKGKKKMPESVTRDDHHPDASGGPGSPSMKRARIDEAN
ncbi:hypothetical protein Nepgr_012325 [Nepenthes gracilis]|uniref:HTH myb-type domain-containing protein n=1 Tax=Nepenthes gracilis TaxID=150966 RepID=A0AAD3XN09_NEPGR|nr:hypothetical protein Nepgr_012325 [Nepenthes gracilis]